MTAAAQAAAVIASQVARAIGAAALADAMFAAPFWRGRSITEAARRCCSAKSSPQPGC
jgi:hypothetical protein